MKRLWLKKKIKYKNDKKKLFQNNINQDIKIAKYEKIKKEKKIKNYKKNKNEFE